MILKNWNHLLKELIRVLNKSLAFLTTAKARSLGKHFIFMLCVIRREKSCFADEMGLIIKSRSHFLYLHLSLLSLKRQRRVSKMWIKSGQASDLSVLCIMSKIRSTFGPWLMFNEGRGRETVILRAGVGLEDRRSSRLLGQVRTTSLKDGWWLRPRDLGRQGRKEAHRRNVILVPRGYDTIVHDYLVSAPGGDHASLPRSAQVTSLAKEIGLQW